VRHGHDPKQDLASQACPPKGEEVDVKDDNGQLGEAERDGVEEDAVPGRLDRISELIRLLDRGWADGLLFPRLWQTPCRWGRGPRYDDRRHSWPLHSS
jgi:hypothetical protein